MVDTTQPDKPTALMRVVVGVIVGVFAWSIGGPIIFVLGLLFTLGLVCGAAVALHHVGALEFDTVFRLAHWAAVVPLVVFFIVAYVHRYFSRDAKGTLALVLRWPVLVACVLLPFFTLGVLVPAWDTVIMSPLAGALILADLYFFSIASFACMAYVAFIAARMIYRWSTATRYRAGVVTGALGVPLVVLFALAYRDARADDNNARQTLAERVAPARDPDALESERKFFRLLDRGLEPTHDSTADAPTLQAPVPTSTPLAPAPTASAGQTENDVVTDCLHELANRDVPEVQRNVQIKFRLSNDDAHDIVYEALLNVCLRHVISKYTKLAAVLQTTAENRVLDGWRRRRYSRCASEERPPTCAPFVDEVARAQLLDRIFDDVRCHEDGVTQQIVDRHVREDEGFTEIDKALGLRPNEARWRWNNYINRAQIRLAKDCGN